MVKNLARIVMVCGSCRKGGGIPVSITRIEYDVDMQGTAMGEEH
ncbi:hypothetical protein R6G69_03940 [Actinotignum urinale]|nr:hypothetical protein [Actinotignum urinale]MDY5129146.1 hypothetical protein [Actinotignum urinale]